MFTLIYSPFFSGEYYRNLPVDKTQFESVVGGASLLVFLELKLGLTWTETDPIERILAYKASLGSA